MISVNNLTIETLTGRKLVENLSFNLSKGDKLAVIGEEGNGKSTILKAIYNKKLVEGYCNVEGNVSLNNANIGFLEQKLDPSWENSDVLEYLLKDSPDGDYNYERYNQIDKAYKIFTKYNLNKDYIDNAKIIRTLSGGEKVKLQIAKLQFLDYDAYFLDEPTNDLDIETLEKLEQFMCSTEKPIMFISHDETLLENVANSVLHIEQLIKKSKPKCTLFKGGYADYIDTRKRLIAHQTQMAYSQRRDKEKKEEILRQIKQKVENALVAAKKDPASGRIIAKKMANIKAQERKNEEEELIEVPNVEEAIKLVVDESVTLPSKKEVLKLDIPSLEIGSSVLAKNIALTIIGPEKIAIIGNNGCGKTTLLKEILPLLEDKPGLRVGYFSQNYAENLNYKKTAVEELQNLEHDFNARTLLGSLKFTHEEMAAPIENLSEGQKAKILIMKMIVEKNNVLVLDEPTRNLSPLSNPIIRGVLNSYNGAIIAVSHDRKFINEVCDTVYHLTSNGLTKVDLKKTDDQEIEK